VCQSSFRLRGRRRTGSYFGARAGGFSHRFQVAAPRATGPAVGTAVSPHRQHPQASADPGTTTGTGVPGRRSRAPVSGSAPQPNGGRAPGGRKTPVEVVRVAWWKADVWKHRVQREGVVMNCKQEENGTRRNSIRLPGRHFFLKLTTPSPKYPPERKDLTGDSHVFVAPCRCSRLVLGREFGASPPTPLDCLFPHRAQVIGRCRQPQKARRSRHQPRRISEGTGQLPQLIAAFTDFRGRPKRAFPNCSRCSRRNLGAKWPESPRPTLGGIGARAPDSSSADDPAAP